MTVKVFKTNIQGIEEGLNVLNDLSQIYPFLRININIEDEDKIMRVEGPCINTPEIIAYLKAKGYVCIDLPIDLDR